MGPDGRIKIANTGSQTVQLAVDVYAYTLTSVSRTPGSTFVGLRPARTVSSASVPAGGDLAFSALGVGGVPASGVSQIQFTLVGSASTETPLTVHPSGTTRPTSVSLHAGPGGFKDNLVITQVGADGKVVIHNGGSVAATVWVDVSGYFAAPDAPQVGSLPVPLQPARIVNGVNIPGNGGITVDPRGQAGVPASGATAVGMNVTLLSTNSTGSVRVYPSGEALPGTWTVGYSTPGTSNAGFVNAKLGTDGKVRLHNAGSATVKAWVDLFAYFTPMTGCTPPVTAAPPVSVVESPVTVYQPAEGPLGQAIEYAYTADNGTVWYAHQLDPGSFGGVGFTLVPAPTGEVFSGPPALIDQADDQLRLIAHGVSGNTWTNSQPGADSWSNLGGWAAGPPAVVRQADGTLALFALDGNGTLWATEQTGPNGAYGCWVDTGLTGLIGRPGVSTEPVPGAPGEGRVRVFARDTAGGVKTAVYADRVLSGIADLGGSGLTGSISVLDFPGSRVRIFERAADGAILTKEQSLAGDGFPETWDRVGTFAAAGSPSAAYDASARIHVVARGADGIVHHAAETGPSSGVWGDWSSAQPDGDSFRTAVDPTAFTYTFANGGTFWAYVIRDSIRLVRVYTASTTASATGERSSSGFTATTLATRQK